MAEDIVPMALVSENVAGIGEFFFEFSQFHGDSFVVSHEL
jgi:hypothetical protein